MADETSVIDNLRRLSNTATEHEVSHNPDTVCQICTLNYSLLVDGDGEIPVMTFCGHIFGRNCLKKWILMTESPTCPFCRSPFRFDCGHLIYPRAAFFPTTPPKINQEEIRPRCHNCRTAVYYHLKATTLTTIDRLRLDFLQERDELYKRMVQEEFDSILAQGQTLLGFSTKQTDSDIQALVRELRISLIVRRNLKTDRDIGEFVGHPILDKYMGGPLCMELLMVKETFDRLLEVAATTDDYREQWSKLREAREKLKEKEEHAKWIEREGLLSLETWKGIANQDLRTPKYAWHFTKIHNPEWI